LRWELVEVLYGVEGEINSLHTPPRVVGGLVSLLLLLGAPLLLEGDGIGGGMRSASESREETAVAGKRREGLVFVAAVVVVETVGKVMWGEVAVGD
jgi:hypothetical protein